MGLLSENILGCLLRVRFHSVIEIAKMIVNKSVFSIFNITFAESIKEFFLFSLPQFLSRYRFLVGCLKAVAWHAKNHSQAFLRSMRICFHTYENL